MKLSSLDYTKWKLPEGAKARLGKGSIKEISYSPDGNLLAVASSIGTWIYDADTGEELDLLLTDSTSINTVNFSRKRHLIPENENEINRIHGSFSEYHRILASGNANGDIDIWDVESGIKIKTLTDHHTPVLSVCFSPDGKILASSSAGWFSTDGEIGVVKLWDVRTGELLNTLIGNTSSSMNSVYCVCFSSNGKIIACARDRWYDFDWDEWKGGTVELWNIESGTLIKVLHTDTLSVNSVTFSGDERLLAGGSEDGTVWLWDVSSHKLLKRLKGDGYEAITSVLFIDENLLLVGSSDGKVRLWDVQTEKHKVLTGLRTAVTSISFSDKNNGIAIGSKDGTVGFWFSPLITNAPSASAHTYITEHNSFISSLAFSSNSCILASGHMDGSLCMWNTETNKQIINYIGHTDIVQSVTFSSDNRYLASGGDDCTVRLLNIADTRKMIEFGAHLSEFNETGIWRSIEDPDITIAEALSGTSLNIKVITGHTDSVKSVCFDPDGLILASSGGMYSYFGGTEDYSIRLWNVQTGKHIRTLTGHRGPVEEVCFSPDGKILASGSWDRKVCLWDIDTGELIRTLTGHTDDIWSICFSPDGQTLASCGREHIIRLWNIITGENINTLLGHTSHVHSISFSCNNQLLVSGSSDKSVCLWNVTNGEHIKTFTGHSGAVNDVSFSPDGKTVVSGSDNGR